MAGLLVLADSTPGRPHETSRELIAAGRRLAANGRGPLRVLVVASEPAATAAELAVPGVEEVLTVTSPVAGFDAHVQAATVSAVIRAAAPALVLAPQSADAMAYAPAVAAELGLGFAADVTEIAWEDGAPVVTASVYGDRLLARLAFPGKSTVLAMMRPGAGALQADPEAANPEAGDPGAPGSDATAAASVPVRDAGITVDLSAAATRHLGFAESDGGAEADVARAPFVLAIGRGVEDRASVVELERIAGELGATLLVSGGLVDAGLGAKAAKVGLTGKAVRPKVYLALGISGASQHVSGLRGAGTIIAVNLDPEAPIFRHADYGAVADLLPVARALPAHFERPER